jgi:hypothetical protein
MAISKLHLIPNKKIVLRLFNYWLNKLVFLTNHMSKSNFICIPLASSPVISHTFPNNPVKSSAGFLYWSLMVRPMRENNINVIKAQAL